MTAVDRDPVTLAREVLGDERAWAALDPGHHPEGQAAVYRLANAAPTLARAALAADRANALADRLDDGHLRYLIRAALNGETA